MPTYHRPIEAVPMTRAFQGGRRIEYFIKPCHLPSPIPHPLERMINSVTAANPTHCDTNINKCFIASSSHHHKPPQSYKGSEGEKEPHHTTVLSTVLSTFLPTQHPATLNQRNQRLDEILCRKLVCLYVIDLDRSHLKLLMTARMGS